jgi:hypothetical protein
MHTVNSVRHLSATARNVAFLLSIHKVPGSKLSQRPDVLSDLSVCVRQPLQTNIGVVPRVASTRSLPGGEERSPGA